MDKYEKIGAVMSKLTPEKISAFRVKQGLPYAVKVNYAKARVREFIQECGRRPEPLRVRWRTGQYHSADVHPISGLRCAGCVLQLP